MVMHNGNLAEVSLWLDFAVRRLAAESYLHNINPGAAGLHSE